MFMLILAVCPIKGMQQRQNSPLCIQSSIMLDDQPSQPSNFFKHNPHLLPVDHGVISRSDCIENAPCFRGNFEISCKWKLQNVSNLNNAHFNFSTSCGRSMRKKLLGWMIG